MVGNFVLVFLSLVEISLGQQVCPDEWERFHDSCYLFAENKLADWSDSSTFCQTQHEAKLAVIESKEEDLMLINHLHHLYKYGSDHSVFFWLGASDSETEVEWDWYTDSRPLSQGYVNWRPGSDHSVFFWLGATDREVEGVWDWYTDGRPLSQGYVNWRPGQPQNRTNEDCLCFWGPNNFNNWDDHYCDTRGYAICERNMTSQTEEIVG